MQLNFLMVKMIFEMKLPDLIFILLGFSFSFEHLVRVIRKNSCNRF